MSNILFKQVEPDQLPNIKLHASAGHHKLAFSCGIFDLLHVGHIKNLQWIKEIQDSIVVIGVNSDEQTKILKGHNRPIIPAIDRAAMIAALECVDYVVIFNEPTPNRILELLQPDIHVKGADYKDKFIPEADFVKSYGGQIAFAPLIPDISTTNIISKIKDHRPAIFLDRDGTLIKDVGYLKNPNNIELLPGVIEALQELKNAGFLLVIVSNQSGVGNGLIKPDEFNKAQKALEHVLTKAGIMLDAVYFCFHSRNDHCSCRKPAPEMILRATIDLNLDLNQSFMVGDKPSDIEAGQRAGCESICLTNDLQPFKSVPLPFMVAKNWPEVIKRIFALKIAKKIIADS